MKIAGIVAEYDPFHAGHAWMIDEVRRAGFDAAVCVMSPSVVQRGGAACFSADVRTRAALAGGADLVLCLPAPYAVRSAEGFAAAAVAVLGGLGCVEAVAFGAETPDAKALRETAECLVSDEFSRRLQKHLRGAAPFAAAREKAAEECLPGSGALLREPNNILGVEYCKAILTQKLPMRPFPIRRVGAAHGAPLGEDVFASASALRRLMLADGVGALAPYVPEACLPVYEKAVQNGKNVVPQAFSVALLSRLRAMSAQEMARTRGVCEGLENRLYAASRKAVSAQQLYDMLKTKRYAHARMRRLALDAALGYTDELPELPPYVHVLGANATGLAVLKEAKKRAKLPVTQSLAQLGRHNAAAQQVAAAHSAAEDLVALCLAIPRPCGTAYTQKMIVRKEEET